MKRYLLSLLGASALALSVGTASPMRATFSGQTGRLISAEAIDERFIDNSEAIQINHINILPHLSATVEVECNGQGGLIVVYLTWRPQIRFFR